MHRADKVRGPEAIQPADHASASCTTYDDYPQPAAPQAVDDQAFTGKGWPVAVGKPKDQANRKRETWKRLPRTPEQLDAATERARSRLAKNPELVAKMEALGRERALIYKTPGLTGRRKGELASLAVGHPAPDAAPAP